jgi:dephospho-CoA kinase
MIFIGLTGGIGAGKSFVASCFKKLGAGVFDADFIVHQLYKTDESIINYAEKNFPGSVVNCEINRTVLSKYFLAYDEIWIKFQSLVHSAVQRKLEIFLADEKKINRKISVLDVPLLLESEFHLYCNLIVFVHVDSIVQEQRLSKRNINREKLNFISSIQLPIELKRKASDFIINANLSKEYVLFQIKEMLNLLERDQL